MSARKRYYDTYPGTPYLEYQATEYENYMEKYPKTKDILPDIIDGWRPSFHPSGFVTFLLHRYEHCGATYGIELRIDGDSKYRLSTYVMSGYDTGMILKQGEDLKEIDSFIMGFRPERYIFD